MESLRTLISRAIEPCVCGGVIAVESESPMAITEAVQRHNATRQHRDWRRWSDPERYDVSIYEVMIEVALASQRGAQSGTPTGATRRRGSGAGAGNGDA